jgi:hypothetical protein
MKKFLVLFLFLSSAVHAQIPGIDSSVRVHTVLMSRIDSSKAISGAAKDTVLIQNGTAVSLARIMTKPVPIIMRYSLGGIEAPFEAFEYDTAWAGSGHAPACCAESFELNRLGWSRMGHWNLHRI